MYFGCFNSQNISPATALAADYEYHIKSNVSASRSLWNVQSHEMHRFTFTGLYSHV